MDLCRRRGGREVFKVEAKLRVDRQTGRAIVRNTEFTIVANDPAHGPGNARLSGGLRPWWRGEGLRQSRRSVDHRFDEAHLADLPATKIVEIERDASSGEGEESRSILARLENERFRGEAVREGDLKLADFDGRSRERPFQRPFRESREVPGGEIDPRTQDDERRRGTKPAECAATGADGVARAYCWTSRSARVLKTKMALTVAFTWKKALLIAAMVPFPARTCS